MGSPPISIRSQPGPGHIVCLTWDSAIPKFGIDRGAGVWNDYGNPDQFRFWFGFGDIDQGIAHTWKGQHLADGLPVITTVFENDGVRYKVEQFAYPLDGPPEERRGDIEMVPAAEGAGRRISEKRARTVPVTLQPPAALPRISDSAISRRAPGRHGAVPRACARTACCWPWTARRQEFDWSGTRDYQQQEKRVDGTVLLDLPARRLARIRREAASPMVSRGGRRDARGHRL